MLDGVGPVKTSPPQTRMEAQNSCVLFKDCFDKVKKKLNSKHELRSQVLTDILAFTYMAVMPSLEAQASILKPVCQATPIRFISPTLICQVPT